MSLLKLSQVISTKLSFDEVRRILKSEVGLNYKLGFIDDDEISLYYIRDWRTESGMDRIPFCQMQMKKSQYNGQDRITFKIANFALVGFGSIPLILILVFFLTEASSLVYIFTLGVYPFFYVGLIVHFQLQLKHFVKDLRQMESRNK